MAAPSIGAGISQLDASDANTWTAATVGNANGSIVDLGVSQSGINPPNTCATFENSSSGTTINNKYSAYSGSWTAVDISAANQAVLFHFAGNPGQFNRVSTDADGITAYIFDSGANRATDYAYDELGGADDEFFAGAANFFPVLLFASNLTTAGAIDDTDVVEIGIAFKAANTGQFGVDFRIDQILHIDGEVNFEDGDGTTQGTWSRYYDLLKATASSGVLYNKANYQERPVYGWGFPVRMNCENFSDSNFTFYFKPSNSSQAFNPPSTGYYSLSVNPSSTSAAQSYTDGVFAYDGGTYALDIDASSQTTGGLTFTRCSFLNTGAVTITDPLSTLTDCTISNPSSVTLDGATITGMGIDSCAGPVTLSSQLASGSDVTITAPDADALQFDFNPADDSGVTYNVAGGSTINYNPTTTGTYNHSNIKNISGSVELDNLSVNNITVQLSTDLTFTVASPTTGGGTITTSTPPVTVDFAIPNIIDDTRYRLYNVTQATEISNGVVSGGGGFSQTLTRGTEYNNNDVVTFLGTYQSAGVAKQVFRASAVLTTGDFTSNDSQADWDNPGPNTLAIDGSTVSECTTDYVGVQVEVVDVDDTTQKSRIAAFIVDAITTADGIRNWVSLDGEPVVTYSTNTSAQVDATVAAIEVINNKAASTLSVKDSFEFDWSDGVDRISAVSGSSIIWLAPARVLLQATGSGVTAQDKIDIANQTHNTVIENGKSFVEMTRIMKAAVAGKQLVSGTTVTHRDDADAKDRITTTVDSSGQRTSITLDGA